jgi:hypothetical protein
VAEFKLDARTEIIVPTVQHVKFVAYNMRRADRDEVHALSGWTPEKALIHSVEHSEMVFCAIHDGFPAVIWGVGVPTILYREGMPWLMGTPVIERNAKRFLRLSRLWVDEILDRFGPLYNVVDARNHVSIRWLRWLGFTIDPPVPLGFQGLPFHRFHMEPK